MVVSVAVVGAGVIGLSAATHLLERLQYNLKVTIIAEKFSPDTISSDRSGGLIGPPRGAGQDKAWAWTESTIRRLETLYDPKDSSVNGITFGEGYAEIDPTVVTGKEDVVQKMLKNFCIIDDQSEVTEYRIPPMDAGHRIASFSTFTVATSIYLPWLLKRFKGLGGVTEERKINNLSELIGSYDIVINCAGLGARELANDPLVYPVCGHIVSVSASWISKWLLMGFSKETPHERVHFIIQHHRVIVGGTNYAEDESCDEDAVVFDKLLKRCKEALPSLCDASIIEKWVGVRPLRKGGTRLEKEELPAGSGTLIHCYGHGHHGVSLSWGCAEEIGDIVEETIIKK